MKKIRLVLLIVFTLATCDFGALTLIGRETFIYAQEETLTLLTSYPAPYGVYDQMQAIYYKDRNYPNYYLNLSSISKIESLNIGIDPANTVEKTQIQIGDTLAADSNDQAGIYAKTVDINRADIAGMIESGTINNYAAIYAESTGTGTSNNTFYGIYAKSISDTASNIAIYGLATGSSDLDYGIYGVGDDCGIVGGPGKVDIAGFFGKDTTPSLPVDNYAIYGVGQDVDVSGEIRQSHGIYSKTTASDKYGGYFQNLASSGDGIRAWSTANSAIFASGDYGGYFESDEKGIYLANESTSTSYAEITCGDDELSIQTGGSASGSAYLTFMPPYNKNILLYVIHNNTDPDYPGSSTTYMYWYCNDDYYTAYIRGNRNIAIAPSYNTSNDKKITIMGSIRWNGSVPVNVADHTYSDLAEPFNLIDKENLEPGDVVTTDKENKGFLRKTAAAYTKTAGIISSTDTAAMTIGYRKDGTRDKPLALAGRVLCKVDASYGEIKPGDLLVSSPTPGYAMKAKPIKQINGQNIYGQGVIIGKALESLKKGKDKIVVLMVR